MRPISLVVAGGATVVIAALFWVFERDLLWMAGVLAAGIWTPMAIRHEEAARRWAVPGLLLGVVVLVGIGVAFWLN